MSKPAEVYDEDVQPVTETEMTDAVNVNSLRGTQAIPMQYKLSETDIRQGKELCKNMVKQIMTIHLPDVIKNKPELKQIIDMQSSFEEFTLQSSFAVVCQGMRLLSQLSNEDCIYTPEGLIDTFKVQALLNVQQQCMNLVMQFNAHVRRLPQVLVDMIRDVEYSQTFQIEMQASKQITESGTTSSKPIAVLIREATATAIEAKAETIEPEQLAEPSIPDAEIIADGDGDDDIRL